MLNSLVNKMSNMKGKDSLMKMLLAAGPASITISPGPGAQNPNYNASGSTSTSSSSTLTSPMSDQVEEYAAYRSSSYLKQLTSHNVSDNPSLPFLPFQFSTLKLRCIR